LNKVIGIHPIAAVAPDAVETLLDRAFGPDRHGRTAYRMRAGTSPIPALSFAALDADGALLGTLQSWPVELAGDDGSVVPMTMVGPVAVEPAVQQSGIGQQLMQALMDAAAGERMIMIGDPEYYGRFFGFSADATAGWRVDGPVERRRLLAHLPAGTDMPLDGAIRPRTNARFAQSERIA
jgi:predicted N-acetyltransferase YhbS